MHVHIDRNHLQLQSVFNNTANEMQRRIENVFGERPVRFLNARGATTWAAIRNRPDGWSQEQADSAGVTLEEANEQGITIVNHGTLMSPDPARPMLAQPPAYSNTVNRTQIQFTFFDTYTPSMPEESQVIMPLEGEEEGWTNGGPLLEFGPRVFVHLNSLAYMCTHVNDYAASGRTADRRRADFTLDTIEHMWSHAMNAIDHDAATLNPDEFTPEIDTDLIGTVIRERSSDGIRTLRDTIDQNVDSLTAAERQLETLQQNLRGQQAQLEALMRNSVDVTAADVEREISAIQRHAQVEMFYVQGSPAPRAAATRRRRANTAGTGVQLIVLTSRIPMPHPLEPDNYAPVEMGPYELRFSFGQNRNVAITNLENSRGGYDHPHVRGGSFCAGNWQGTVNELLMQGQLASAVNFICACLEQVNAADAWGASYRLWFEDAQRINE